MDPVKKSKTIIDVTHDDPTENSNLKDSKNDSLTSLVLFSHEDLQHEQKTKEGKRILSVIITKAPPPALWVIQRGSG